MSTATPPASSRPAALRPAFVVSVTAGLLLAVGSVLGLVHPEAYPAGAREELVPNDAVNLLLGVPALLTAAWWGWRGSLLATLAWPGALGYVTYSSTAYVVGLPIGWPSVVAALLLALSSWGVVAVLGQVDGRAVRDRIAGAVPIRFGGWVVLVLGVVLGGRSAAALAGDALTRQQVGVLAADLVVSLAWGVAGVVMVRRRPAGYALGLGVLTLANLLFAGLVVLLLLQPALTDREPATGDLLVVAAMWTVLLVPGARYGRGVAARARERAARPARADVVERRPLQPS